MNSQADLVRSISEKAGVPKDLVREVLRALNDYSRETLIKTGELRVRGLFAVGVSSRTTAGFDGRPPEQVDTLVSRLSEKLRDDVRAGWAANNAAGEDDSQEY